MVLGHEGAGVVEEVGDAVDARSRRRRGRALVGAVVRRVRGLPPRPARDVRAAQRGDPQRDAADGTTGMSLRGETVYRGTATGCLGRAGRRLRRRSRSRSGGAVPLRAGRAARLRGPDRRRRRALRGRASRPAASVLVIGAGGVGQFVVQGARIAGAEAIVVVDPVEARREQALRARRHARRRIPTTCRDAIRSVAPDGADYGFDAVGVPGARARRRSASRASGGTTVIVGLPPTGAAARPRPVRADPEGEVAHRDAVRVGGSGRLAAGPARARRGRSARARLAARRRRSRSTASTRRSRRASRGEAGRVLVVP